MKFIIDGMTEISESEIKELLFDGLNLSFFSKQQPIIYDGIGAKTFDYRVNTLNEETKSYSWTSVNLYKVTCSSNREGIFTLKVSDYYFDTTEEFYHYSLLTVQPAVRYYKFRNDETMQQFLDVMKTIKATPTTEIYPYEA